MHRQPSTVRFTLAIFGILAWLPLAALADDLIWSVAGGGAWDYATANWSGDDTIFEDGDSVTFNNTAGGIITVTNGVLPAATTISAGGSNTYTFTGGSIGGGTLSKSGAGIAQLAAANTFSSVALSAGTLRLQAVGAIGTAAATISGGGFQLALPANSNFGNHLTFTAGIPTFGATTPTTYAGTLTVNSGATVSFGNNGAGGYNNNLLILTTPAVGTGNARVSRGNLAISNMNQLPAGNLAFTDGPHSNALILDGIPWSGAGSFLAARPSWGTGASQVQGTYLAIAARGDKLTIDAEPTGLAAGSLLDRSWGFGSWAVVNGQPYADQDVEVAVNGILTARRTYGVAMYGPGMTGQHGDGNQTIISGNLSGTGALVVSNGHQNPINNAPAELVLAGLNSWTGSISTGIGDGTVTPPVPNRYINTGRGGLAVSAPSGTSSTFVIFDGNVSLPSGAQTVGLPAYLAASSRYGITSGYLLTGTAGGETYTLPSQYKFLLGGNNTPVLGSTGEAGSTATLSDSAILLHSDSGAAMTLNLLVRGGTLALGEAALPVKLQPSTGWDTGDLGLNAAATAVADNAGTRTLIKRGEGTLVLDNLAYTQVDGTGDTASQFVWQIGRASGSNQGTGAYFDGAVRGLADNDPLADNSNSLKNFAIALRGGVYEVDGGGAASSFTRDLGAAAGQVNWSTGGGGFAAYDGDLAVNLGGAGATFTWASTASFVTNNQSLIFGSTTATGLVDFQNGINFNGAVREIRVLDNPDSAGDWARISGALIGTTSSGLTKTGAGRLELTNANTYTGVTTVAAGILAVDGSLNASSSLVGVVAGAILTGDGSILRPVSVDAGATLAGNLTIAPQGSTSATVAGTLAPGNSIGTLTFDFSATSGGLILLPGATLEFELGPAGSGDLVRLVGYQPGDLTLNNNLIDLINAGGLAKDTTYPLFAFFAADGVTPVEHGLTDGLLLGAVPSGFTGFLLDFSSDPSLIQLYVIPEPSTALLLLGLAGLAARRRRRSVPVRRCPAGLAAISGVCLTALATFSAANGATIIQWNNANPTGNWSVASNWLGGVAPHTANPGTTDYAVIVDGEPDIPVVTTLDRTVWMDTLQISAGDKVVNNGGHGIRFAGTTNTWSNAGTISGEVAGSMFDLQSGSGVINVNSGTLQGNGGGLQLGGSLTYSINNATGTIQAINGGTLHLRTQNVTITGGILAIDSTSKMNATDVQPKFTFANVTAVNHGLIDWNQDGGGPGRIMSLTFSGTTTLLNSPTGQISLKQADMDSSNWSAWMKFQDTAGFNNQGQLTITSDIPSALAASKAYVEIAATAAGNFSNTGTIAINHTSASSAHTAQLIAGGSIGNAGTIKVDGIGASVELGTNTFTQTAGELVLHNLGSITAGTVDLQGGSLAGVGTVFADVHAATGVTIAPGNSAGTLTISGDLVLSAGTILDFELGTLAGANDLIVVGGDLVLDGILNITDLGGLERGIYTLFLYEGLLVDNGLTLGSIPRPGMLLVGDGAVRLLVPEPTSGILAGLASLLLPRRRRMRR